MKQLGIDRGNPGWETGFTAALAQKGAGLGITFDFSVDVGNSLESLRLLWWAGTKGAAVQNQLADRLSKAHFEEGRCVCAEATLLAAVAEVGLSEDEARVALRQRAFEDEVNASIEREQAKGHHSIPMFRFEAPHASLEVHGAASEDEFKSVLVQFAESWPTKVGGH